MPPEVFVLVELPGVLCDWTSVESLLPPGAVPSDPRASLLQRRLFRQQGLDLIQKSFQQHVRTLQVMGLTRTEMKTHWIAEGITGCMDFGRQTSAGATDTFLGAITFFAPALC